MSKNTVYHIKQQSEYTCFGWDNSMIRVGWVVVDTKAIFQPKETGAAFLAEVGGGPCDAVTVTGLRTFRLQGHSVAAAVS